VRLRKALLLINRHARNGAEDPNKIVQNLRTLGIEAVCQDAGNQAALDQIRDGRANGYDLVIVGGGDGSINRALPALLASELPLGVLPLGTGNDLARTLGIPLNLQAACEVIANGHTHRIDVGEVNGSAYVNVASMGVSVAVTRQLDPATKKALGPFAYAVSAWRALRSSKPFTAQITCDGKSIVVRSVQIAVGNGRHYGGGMTVDENATLDDSMLHLYSLAPRPFWHYVLLAPALRAGRHRTSASVVTLQGQHVRIETDRPMRINTDGEMATRTPAEFLVRPATLSVLVPPSASEKTETAHASR
jgi:diacylglycerol kinase (ATP)